MLKETRLLNTINKKVDEIAATLQKANIQSYVELMQNSRRLLYLNFLMGISRGFGMAVGFTLLSAVALYILRMFVTINLPIIGKFIAEIVKIVEDSR